jgi:flagellar protein FlaI
MADTVVLRPGKGPNKPVIRPGKRSRPSSAPALNEWFRGLLAKGSKTRPGFAEAWIGDVETGGLELVLEYEVRSARVRIFMASGGTETLYQLVPMEYGLDQGGVDVLFQAKTRFSDRMPEDLLTTTARSLKDKGRGVAREVISELSQSSTGHGTLKSSGGLDFLTETLLTHTVGYGVLEYLMDDSHVQDIYIDAPADENPVHVVIGDVGDERVHGKCLTNVLLSEREVKALISRFRYESGRPFSEAMPVLETDLQEYDTRVTVVGRPLSPHGAAIALRRHSVEPWTLLKLMDRKSLDPLGAGLLSFLIDGRSTILVAGSRGAGKSSLLGAMMLEFPLSQRILTIEDTLELPVPKMQELGYKVQSLFVQSAIGGTGDRTTDDALRVSLRLGESAIVLGEVRGREAKTLYEAMRSGSAGSAVLGTIHGNSARSVFERIVYDLDIHPEAFSATDIVVICGLVRPGGRQRQVRRVVSVSEVAKDSEPGTFRELLAFNESLDRLVETEHFAASSRIGQIARDWGLSIEEALENIRTRARMRELALGSSKAGNPNLLTPGAAVKMNGRYWSLVDELGSGDASALMKEWESWFARSAPYV